MLHRMFRQPSAEEPPAGKKHPKPSALGPPASEREVAVYLKPPVLGAQVDKMHLRPVASEQEMGAAGEPACSLLQCRYYRM